jgi:hypothetical protein
MSERCNWTQASRDGEEFAIDKSPFLREERSSMKWNVYKFGMPEQRRKKFQSALLGPK